MKIMVKLSCVLSGRGAGYENSSTEANISLLSHTEATLMLGQNPTEIVFINLATAPFHECSNATSMPRPAPSFSHDNSSQVVSHLNAPARPPGLDPVSKKTCI